MNRNLDGTPLTHEQHIALTLEAGMPRSKVTRDTKTYVFEIANRSVRYAKFQAGELLLDTRYVERPVHPTTIDREVVAYLTRGAT